MATASPKKSIPAPIPAPVAAPGEPTPAPAPVTVKSYSIQAGSPLVLATASSIDRMWTTKAGGETTLEVVITNPASPLTPAAVFAVVGGVEGKNGGVLSDGTVRLITRDPTTATMAEQRIHAWLNGQQRHGDVTICKRVMADSSTRAIDATRAGSSADLGNGILAFPAAGGWRVSEERDAAGTLLRVTLVPV